MYIEPSSFGSFRNCSKLLVIYQNLQQLPKEFHEHYLHTNHHIYWSDFFTYIEKAKITSVENTLIKSKLCWAAHISGLENRSLHRIIRWNKLSDVHWERKAP